MSKIANCQMAKIATIAIIESHLKKVSTLLLTFWFFKNVGLLRGRVRAGAGVATKYLPGARAV
jgi:hypothetical protein